MHCWQARKCKPKTYLPALAVNWSLEPQLSLTLTWVSATVFQIGCTHPWQFQQLYEGEKGCKQTIIQATTRSQGTNIHLIDPLQGFIQDFELGRENTVVAG